MKDRQEDTYQINEDNQNPSKHQVPNLPDLEPSEQSTEATRQRITDEPDSIGLDIDGTNPGSNAHSLDIEDQKENR